MSTKLIVSNETALKSKYGQNLARVKRALARLKAADKIRGIQTRIVYIDKKSDMRKFNAVRKRVTDPTNSKQNKDAVDKVYKSLKPDYLVIFGANDVIAQQDMKNGNYEKGGIDDDFYAWGDLPYACDAPYSKKIHDFLGATRVVGRIPDIDGGSDVRYIEKLISNIVSARSRSIEDYDEFLAITAKAWAKASEETIKGVFGQNQGMRESPDKGPDWRNQLKSRIHFINCHGGDSDPQQYGDPQNYPVAHSSKYLAAHAALIQPGTIFAAECCYGAQLYDPKKADNEMPIVNVYLHSGAYAVFGSSTVAYGAIEGNECADLLVGYFLKHLRAAASTGRAVLQARQDYVMKLGTLDQADLKTLGQFSLMGDPSIHPVGVKHDTRSVIALSGNATMAAHGAVLAAKRMDRRRHLAALGDHLARNTGHASRRVTKKPGRHIHRHIQQVLGVSDLSKVSLRSYAVKHPAYNSGAARRTIHIATYMRVPSDSRSGTLVIVDEINGRINSSRRLARH